MINIVDDQVAASAVPMADTVREGMSYSQSEVRISSTVRSLSSLRVCSYISEAAASLIDERLSLNIVPKTQLVSLSSSVSRRIVFEDFLLYAEMYPGFLLRLARPERSEEGQAFT